jgi:hypothetical protein
MSQVYPTPHAVAAAIVAACERTGEDPLAVLQVTAPPPRAVLAVTAALREVFPHHPWKVCGRMAGLALPHAQSHVGAARQRRWWPGEGEPALRAARNELVRGREEAARDEPKPAPPPAAKASPIPVEPGGRTLADRVVQALKSGAHTSSGLASRLDVKELVICQTLSLLRHAGQVTADDPGEQGVRQQLWRLKPAEAA